MKSLLALLPLLFVGCTYVPVTAEKATYTSTHPFGGTTINVENPKVTEEQVTADSYHRQSRWGWLGVTVISQDVSVTGYARDRQSSDGAKIPNP